MVTLSMFDNISAGSIPANCEACAGYVDGSWPDFPAMVSRFPNLAKIGRVVSIATSPNDIARILDKEKGNPASVQDCVAWVKRMVAHGIYKPGVYSDLEAGDMGAVAQALASSGLKRSQYTLWLADWNGVANVPGGYDAHQYTDKAGPNDESICLETFFPPVVLPPSGIAKAELEFNVATGQWVLQSLPGTVSWQADAKWASVEIQLGVGGNIKGQWRTKSLPWNAEPLGG